MKKLLLLLPVIALVAVSCNRSTPVVNQPAPNDAQIDASTWKSYANQEYGLSFKHPANWDIVLTYPNGEKILDLQSAKFVSNLESPEVKDNVIEFARGAELGVYFEPKLTQDIIDYVAVQGQAKKFEQEGFLGSITVEKQVPAVGENTPEKIVGERIVAYKVFPSGKVAVIQWNRANYYHDVDITYEAYLIPILKSFNFINN